MKMRCEHIPSKSMVNEIYVPHDVGGFFGWLLSHGVYADAALVVKEITDRPSLLFTENETVNIGMEGGAGDDHAAYPVLETSADWTTGGRIDIATVCHAYKKVTASRKVPATRQNIHFVHAILLLSIHLAVAAIIIYL